MLIFFLLLSIGTGCAESDQHIRNRELSVAVDNQIGSYKIISANGRVVLSSVTGAQIDRRWITSSEYPTHSIEQSDFRDVLGHGQELEVSFHGLSRRPNLSYILRLYDEVPVGDIEVKVSNGTSRTVSVESIRSLEAFGTPLLDLGGNESSERILSDAFSESTVHVYDLENAPEGRHWAAGSQLVYNRDSKQSLFFGALTSDRFLTVLRLTVDKVGHKMLSYVIDSTGTTEARSQGPWFRRLPISERVELSLPLAPGASMVGERVMFALGNDYHAQLENYGIAIRKLHHARVDSPNLMGWWSWTAHYTNISEDVASTNAHWLAQHLRNYGFTLFHIDDGYEFSRGEYTTPDPSKFPRGMQNLAREILELGLELGIWVAPLDIDGQSSVYKAHKNWLVRDSQGKPLGISGTRDGRSMFVLDATNPDAQEYLRHTFQTFAQQWHAHYLKLDFMDETAVEGYYYRPHTTALEAQRIALGIIRDAVGEDVLLDKDGSPILNCVGLVDEGRISGDTRHSFDGWKETATGLLARYYMHRNFFVNDPDAFTLQRVVPLGQIGDEVQKPLTLPEAQISITLAAFSGGMFEIGDDLPTLASEPERLSLITNPDVLQLAKLGKVGKPIDLLDYSTEDLQPSVTFLRENDSLSALAVFNWTEQARTHEFNLTDLGLPDLHNYKIYDVLDNAKLVPLNGNKIVLPNQPPHSVRLLKIIDESQPAGASMRQPRRLINVGTD